MIATSHQAVKINGNIHEIIIPMDANLWDFVFKHIGGNSEEIDNHVPFIQCKRQEAKSAQMPGRTRTMKYHLIAIVIAITVHSKV